MIRFIYSIRRMVMVLKMLFVMHGLKMGSILYVMLQILFFLRKGSGTAGVAIDAEVVFLKDRYYLYYATRTPDYSTQIIRSCKWHLHIRNFSKQAWKSPGNHRCLFPEYLVGKRSVSKEHLLCRWEMRCLCFMPGPIIIVLSRLELLKVVMVFIGQNFLINPF